MSDFAVEPPKILSLYLQLSQYPILAHEIRRRMRDELFRRGVITPARLEQEAREKAVLSQVREGLTDPYIEEDTASWEQRLQQIRDHLTDFYFAYNLPLELFHRIVEELLAGRRSGLPERAPSLDEISLTFNPELAPVDLLIRKVAQFAGLAAGERERVRHHIEEMNVVLIKALISDQLGFVGVAKHWLEAADFQFILQRRIGSGKIGGKAAGMLLAWKIIQQAAPELAGQTRLARSYFIGADVFYEYLALNKVEYINQKYKSAEQIRADYPHIRAEYEQGRFPEEIAEALRDILRQVGARPLIVRSSSLLEDNFGTSFAGKYDSFFCPNQGSLKENLRDLTLAIRRIYASVYSPDALIYRRRMGLLDYDERMAILLQEVEGQDHHGLFFPALAGVAFSRSPIVWSPRLRREEGFLRLVLGLGTRAVERVGEDYPRLLFLSHPQLRPETTPSAISHYSQRLMDVIDLQANALRTVPVRQALNVNHPALRWLASLLEDDTLLPLKGLRPRLSPDQLVLTFDGLIQRSDFIPLVKGLLSTLARHYGFPVDVEFAAELQPDPAGGRPAVQLCLLQCRPQSTGARGEDVLVPADVPADDQLFLATRMVPQGRINQVEYLLYVPPAVYQAAGPQQRQALARTIGLLNKRLEGQAFVLIGPGRWGSSNIQLGVPVTYADIYNARALVELALGTGQAAPEPSYGTHFFQDLVESNIHPLALYPDEPGDFLNRDFLDQARDGLAELLPGEPAGVRVIRVAAERPGQRLDLVMDGERALAHFVAAE